MNQSVIADYTNGISSEELGRKFNVVPGAVRRYLRENGVTIRTISEAGLVLNSFLSQKERIRKYNHGKYPIANAKRALTHQRTRSRIGKGENELFNILINRGIKSVQQKAIGPYNIDIAVFPVAVEIERSPAHPFDLKYARKRIKHLTDAGWFVISIWIPRYDSIITETCVEKLISYLQIAQSKGALRCKHRVIRGSGKDATFLSTDIVNKSP